MTLIYAPHTVNDDELAFAATILDTIDTLEITKSNILDEIPNDNEALSLRCEAWATVDDAINDLITAMHRHGWLVVYCDGRVAAFARDDLEVNVG